MVDNSGLIYFKDGELLAESGEVKVYKLKEELFLEIGPGHNLWALSSEIGDYVWQLKDSPKGDCLEIGLGLGVASKYILSCPKVKSLTTVEINEDVVNVYKKINKEDKRHTILNCDGLLYAYKTNKRYNFIFMDFYDRIDEETLPVIADMVNSCKRILKTEGKIMGWFDKATPEEFVNKFYLLFNT